MAKIRKVLTWRRRQVKKFKEQLCEKYPQKYELWMCLAKRKGKKGRCKRRAIKETLRCRLHGGKSPGAPQKTGKYSLHGKGKFIDVYEEFLRDPNAINLVDELAVLRTLVSEIIEMKTTGEFSRNDRLELSDRITGIIDAIGRMAERLRKIHTSYFSMESLYIVIQHLITLIEKDVNFCPHCKKPIHEVRDTLCKDIINLNIPGPGIKDTDYEIVKT